MNAGAVPLKAVNPIRRAEPFDDPAWGFELKFDGFRCIADTLDQRLVSKHQNRMRRFEPLVGTLPYGYVFDGEIVCLDETGRPSFNDLLFRKREPVYVAFDVLNVEGADVRGLPLRERRAVLDRLTARYRLQKSELFFGCGRSLFNAVCEFDLEGIIAKRLNDPYEPDRTKWWKILNPNYSQKEGRTELFEQRSA